MAVALSNTQTYENTGTGSTQTQTGYTPAAGSNRILVVRIHGLRTSESGAFTVDTVTFGGVSMTQAVTVSTTSSSRTYRTAIWYLINPSGSSGDVVATFSHASNSTIIATATLTDAAQTSPVISTDSDYNDGTISYLTLQLTGTIPSGSIGIYAATTHCNNNPTFSWTGPFTEEYDIRTASNTSTEVAGSGGWRDTYLSSEVLPEPTQAWPKCGAAVGFLPAITPIAATAADTLDLADSPTRQAIYRKTAADALGAADSPTRRGIYRKTAAETLDWSDSPVRRGIFGGVAVDNTGLTADATPRRVLRATVTESLGLAGTPGKRLDYQATLADLFDVLETAAGGSRISSDAADALGIADSAGPGYHIRRVTTDTWLLAPVAAARADFVTTVTDMIALAESADYPLPADSGQFEIEPYEDSSQGSDGLINITNNENSCSVSNPYNALEFRDIDVPRFAVPTVAYLKLYPIISDDPGLTIRAEKTAAPGALTTTNYDISSRTPLTTAGVEWSAANIGTGGYRNSPDISEVLQEVFALEDWTRGESDMVVILSNNGTGGNLRYGTSEASADKRPSLYVEWYIGGIPITAIAADILAVMDSASRRAIVAAATADSLSLATATTTTLALLLSETWQLQETVNLLARLNIGDAALLGDSVYLTYALSLTEPLGFFDALNRIAALRAAPIDLLDYVEEVQTTVATAVGDEWQLSAALIARRILVAALNDVWQLVPIPAGDIAGILEALALDTWGATDAAAGGWTGYARADDEYYLSESMTALRRFLALALDAGAIGDIAALITHARATASDTAGFAVSLRTLMRTRAVDTLDLSDSALSAVATLLLALAADVLAFNDGLNSNWRIVARDQLEFTAAVGAVMHWVESVQDALHLSDAAVFLLPNGIVRVEFSIKGIVMQFDIVMPRVDIEAHGLIE